MRKTILLIFVAMLAVTWSCQKEEAADKLVNEIENVLKAEEFEGTIPVNCGYLADCFTAGQHIDVGQFIIANDEGNLYIKYDAEEPWLVFEVQFIVVDDLADVPNARGNPIPGEFPYKFDYYTDGVQSAAFVLSLDELGYEIGDKIYVVAHAVVGTGSEMVDDELVILDEETAFGGCEEGPTGNRWWFYAEYTLAPCNGGPYPPDCEWVEETAYGGNSTGAGSAWWFYFDTEGPETQNIYAGQKLVDGASVTFENGTITIILGENMRLQDDEESVKILGYNLLPDSRPASGASNPNQLYAGTSLTVEVDEFNFYVIHIDVEVWVCPEEDEE